MELLIDWLMQPLGMVSLGLLLTIVLWLCGPSWTRWSGGCLILSCCMLWVFSAPVTANALVRLMESPPPNNTSACGSVAADVPVIILGASLDAYTRSNNPYEVLSHDSLIRTLRAVDLDSGQTIFYVLGGGSTSRKLSDFMAQVLQDGGIPEQRIVKESDSLSTLENAINLTQLLPEARAYPIVLVTSALHLKRAQGTFEAQGFNVECAVGVASLYSVSAGWVGYLPHIDSLHKSTLAWREWLATQLYYWRGYSVR